MRVHGVGPVPCQILLCGEGPGYFEAQQGRPFVGRTGQELDRFLNGQELPTRDKIFLTNIFREYKGQDYVWTAGDQQRDEPDLITELEKVWPKTIVPLGRYATRWLLGDVDMEAVWGIPWRLPAGRPASFLNSGQNTVVLPIHHPAAGMHNPEMSPYVVAGFAQLAQFLAGKLKPRVLFDDAYLEPHYEEITTINELDGIFGLANLDEPSYIAIDTEGWAAKPWSVQFSFEPGTGYCIRATHPELLARFRDCLSRGQYRLVFHSALHDLSVGRQLGCFPERFDFDDTMAAAYLLQLEPQGLKALCSRHAGMQMQSYDDVLGDAGQRLALDYCSALWSIEQHEYEERRKEAFWQEIDKGRCIKVYPKLPKPALHKAAERALRSNNTRNLWNNQIEDIRAGGYNLLGTMPTPTLDHVSAPTAIAYGCRDADGTGRVLGQLTPRLHQLGLRNVYTLELSTYPLIERMSHVGIKPNLRHFAALSSGLAQELERLQTMLESQSGVVGLNANSGDQIANYLFDTCGLEPIKSTKSGRGSTNDKILEALEHEHPEYPVISTIREYREVYKLKHTFVDRLPDFVRRWPFDGRIHATFRTTRVVTGRLAASDPNLLAMPKHGKFARDFRRGWVPEDGHILCEWDLSQIELRVLAHLSQDPKLLDAFRQEFDLHARLAQRIFGGTESDHKKGTTRLAAKAINFGLAMGMTCKGLSVELRKNGVDADEDDAQKWLDETMVLYRQVPAYQTRMAAEAESQGYVRCLSGRIRYIGGIRSNHRPTVEEARRFAFATPVQEGAQWIMKMAESRMWDMLLFYWKDKMWIEPLIQIHDSLLIECQDDMKLARDVHQQMVAIMTTPPPGFTVPIGVSGEWGRNWCAYDEKAPYSPSTPGNGDMVAFDEA